MRARSVRFSSDDVRAIIGGTKTQAWWAMKPQPPTDVLIHVGEYAPVLIDRHGEMHPGLDVFGVEFDDGSDGGWCLKCPYGAPRDRLWVKEPWQMLDPYDSGLELPKTPFEGMNARQQAFWQRRVRYRADFFPRYDAWERDVGPKDVERIERWRPSIHMPRWASRITLEIIEVRVRRKNGDELGVNPWGWELTFRRVQ